jgi:tetratricopeptide (TPR) repeat protein/GGDEF domain-containing protein
VDLLPLEGILCSSLRAFFSFTAHSYYFPRKEAQICAEYLPRERKLLLPLQQQGGDFLGFFVAAGVQGREIAKLLPFLPAVAGLCLDKAALFRQSRRDATSGLYNRSALFEALAEELERLRGIFPQAAREGGGPGRPGRAKRSGQFGLLLLRLDGLDRIALEHGYLRAEDLLRLLGLELEKSRPRQALASRSGEAEFALLLPEAGPRPLEALARDLGAKLGEVSAVSPLTGLRLRVALSAGYVSCPRDLRGLERRDAGEQARHLLQRASLAALAAAENRPAGPESGPPPLMAYADILREGGRVLEKRPLSRLLVSLGSSAGARAGQIFTLWEPGGEGKESGPRYKGDVFLVEAGTNESLAEVLRIDDPLFPPEAGDRLRSGPPGLNYPTVFYPDDQKAGSNASSALPEGSGPAPLADFLPRWVLAREKYAEFSLVLGRFTQTQPSSSENWEKLMESAAERCRKFFGPELLLGRYAFNSLIFFLPEADTRTLLQQLRGLSGDIALDSGLDSAFGLAAHPFLDFRKAEALDNVNKALDYALLLPPPHIGELDSLALNINADRLHSLGDFTEAMAEYRRALLCDPDNILAWNSLGVILADLGRHGEALRSLEEALRRDPTDVNTLYNLGNLQQNRRAFAEARNFYLRCLDLARADPGEAASSDDSGEIRVFACYRLGQIAEEEEDFAAAEKYYRLASGLPGGAVLTRRGLARLAIKKGKPQEAREELHAALLLDPRDAVSLQLLAGLYLDAGEDPAVAESLARQSVSLRPDLRPAWLELARALEACGKKNAAREALIRAGEL